MKLSDILKRFFPRVTHGKAPVSPLTREMLADPETKEQLLYILESDLPGVITFKGIAYKIR